MRSFFLVLDLMISKDGRVQILELQDGERSGFSGYKKAYGQSMDKLEEDYRQKNGLVPDIRPHLFKSICDNKAIQSTFAYPVYPSIFPKHLTYALVPNLDQRKLIDDFFPDDERLVVKVPNAAMGQGVFYFDKSSLQLHAAQHVRNVIEPIFSGHFDTSKKQQNHVVIQSCVDPRVITIQNQFYRPTIRTALTITWDIDDYGVKPSIHIHGSYYKLPAPFEIEDSFSPHQLKSNVHEGIGSARIEPDDEQAIFNQIPPAISAIFEYCLQHGTENVLKEKLSSNNAGDVVSAIIYMRQLDKLRSEYSFNPSPEFQEWFKEFATRQFQKNNLLGFNLYNPWRGIGLLNIPDDIHIDIQEVHQRIRSLTEEFCKKSAQLKAELKIFQSLSLAFSDVSALVEENIKGRSEDKLRKKRERVALKERLQADGIPRDYLYLSALPPLKRDYFVANRIERLESEIDMLDRHFKYNTETERVWEDLKRQKLRSIEHHDHYLQHPVFAT